METLNWKGWSLSLIESYPNGRRLFYLYHGGKLFFDSGILLYKLPGQAGLPIQWEENCYLHHGWADLYGERHWMGCLHWEGMNKNCLTEWAGLCCERKLLLGPLYCQENKMSCARVSLSSRTKKMATWMSIELASLL
jgi:hypothetical protein